jgi:hypothetical protein
VLVRFREKKNLFNNGSVGGKMILAYGILDVQRSSYGPDVGLV